MTHEYGRVGLAYGLARRFLIPIYGLDQFLTLAGFGIALLFLCLRNGWSSGLGVSMAIGAYIGFVIAMGRSTPCSLLLPASEEHAVAAVLDNSRLLKRTSHFNEWMSVRGRLQRWDSDTIRLTMTPNGLLVTGRRYDLTIIANRIETLCPPQPIQIE